MNKILTIIFAVIALFCQITVKSYKYVVTKRVHSSKGGRHTTETKSAQSNWYLILKIKKFIAGIKSENDGLIEEAGEEINDASEKAVDHLEDQWVQTKKILSIQDDINEIKSGIEEKGEEATEGFLEERNEKIKELESEMKEINEKKNFFKSSIDAEKRTIDEKRNAISKLLDEDQSATTVAAVYEKEPEKQHTFLTRSRTGTETRVNTNSRIGAIFAKYAVRDDITKDAENNEEDLDDLISDVIEKEMNIGSKKSELNQDIRQLQSIIGENFSGIGSWFKDKFYKTFNTDREKKLKKMKRGFAALNHEFEVIKKFADELINHKHFLFPSQETPGTIIGDGAIYTNRGSAQAPMLSVGG